MRPIIGLKLKLISDNMSKRANNSLQELGLTISQHRVIAYLSVCPEHTTELKELERQFHVAQATMAGTAQRLEAKGLVTAVHHPSDKRIKMIRLTESGLELSRKSLEEFRKGEARMMAGLSEEDLSTLNRLLDAVYSNLRSED